MEIKNNAEEVNNVNETSEEIKTGDSQTEEAPTSDKSEQDKSDEKAVDYKAELERVQNELKEKTERLKKAEFTLYKKNKAERTERQHEDDSDDTNESAEDVDERIAKILAQAKQEHLMTLAQDNLESELSNYSDDPDRQALIKYHYENTINRRGYARTDIKKDLEIAAFLADKPKFEARMSEVNKAIEAEKSKKKGGVAAGVKTEDATQLNLSEADKALLRRHGLTEKDVLNNINS